MYFFNRAEAGRLLAAQLKEYRYENTIVMCLSKGAVLVGQEIAQALHCSITMLLMEEISLPNEKEVTVGTVDQSGGFTFNNMYSAGELEEFYAEYHGHIENEKMNKMHEINAVLGEGGIIDRDLMREYNIILVADGLKNGFSIHAAMEYLKPVKYKRLIGAVPVASVPAVDKLHLAADEIHVLDVRVNYIDTDHYYEDNFMPDNGEIHEIMRRIVLKWH